MESEVRYCSNGGAGVDWQWFMPGAQSTLKTLDPGKYYMGILTTACTWEIP